MPGTRRRQWLGPILLLSGVALLAFAAFYGLDHLLGDPGGATYFDFPPDRIVDAVGSLSGMIAAVLGIVITVVSIIVQLSAVRYARVTEMFFRDRTNRVVMAFYVIGCMWGIFVSFSLGSRFVPRISLTVLMAVAVACFGLMAPYFAYVFDFLQPEQIIRRIRRNAVLAAGRDASGQVAVVSAMEQLTDITINSIGSKDKIIATAGVDALKELGERHLQLKKTAAPGWFVVGPELRQNPDFVSLSPGSVEDLVTARTWVEWKLLRQFQAIYGEALQSMRDLNHVIAIDTRYLGEAAIAAGDREALALCTKFFNSYLRATLNARDVRTAYNVLNQYRQLAEALIEAGWDDRALEVANHIKYYGHVSFGMKLAFVTETVAYDLGALCELAHELGSPVEPRLLRLFLEVDQAAGDADVQETSLRGVRKAQVKLATYYLVRGAEPLARQIHEDMRGERAERLRSIREELEKVESRDFWEVIDRGANFDWLPPDRKAALATFFGWFGRLSTGAAVLLVFLVLTACAGPPLSPGGPLRHTLDDRYLTDIPAEERQIIEAAMKELEAARTAQVQAEAEFRDASNQLTIARGELSKARNLERSANEEKSAASSSGDRARMNDAERLARAAGLARRAAEARVDYLSALRSAAERTVRHATAYVFAREARVELEQAKIASAHGIRPSGFILAEFDKQYRQRADRASRLERGVVSARSSAESRRKDWERKDQESRREQALMNPAGSPAPGK